MSTNALAEARDTSPAVASTPDSLIALAVQRGTDAEQLGKLMDLQERWERQQARRLFFEAMSRFQSIVPPIRRDKQVKFGNTSYAHATLGGIADSIRDALRDCELSYNWSITPGDGGALTVACTLTHIAGHSETNSMDGRPDDSGSKNEIQQRASTVTYLQRYTLIGVLGLTTADEDDDGRSTGEMNVERLRRHNDAVRENIGSVYAIKTHIATGDLERAIEAWIELDQDAQRAIWVAPSKGGIFTTREREVMKSDEWAEVRRAMKGSGQ